MSEIKFGFVSLVGKDNLDYPITQVEHNKRTSKMMVIYPYGLAGNLPADSQVVIYEINDDSGNLVGIGNDPAGRFKNLKEGEVVVGNPKTGSFVKFDSEGNIDVSASKGINISSAESVSITTSKDINISCDNCNVNATKVNLGTGGQQIARKGDNVVVNVGGTDYTGTITTAGVNTSI